MEAISEESFLGSVSYDDNGLVVVVAQDARSKGVLMVAWADENALRTAISTGYMHYYSRSRQKLWRKGESSGNTQKLLALYIDCDGDSILASVEQKGDACHTGRPSCFFRKAQKEGAQ